MQVTEPQELASGYIQIVLKMLKEKIRLNLFNSFFCVIIFSLKSQRNRPLVPCPKISG